MHAPEGSKIAVDVPSGSQSPNVDRTRRGCGPPTPSADRACGRVRVREQCSHDIEIDIGRATVADHALTEAETRQLRAMAIQYGLLEHVKRDVLLMAGEADLHHASACVTRHPVPDRLFVTDKLLETQFSDRAQGLPAICWRPRDVCGDVRIVAFHRPKPCRLRASNYQPPANTTRTIAAVITANPPMTTYGELCTVLSTQDLYNLMEVLVVSVANRRAYRDWLKKQPRED